MLVSWRGAVKLVRAATLRLLVVSAGLVAARPLFAAPKVVVGSKAFPESWILGDAVAELLRSSGAADTEHKKNLGGTEIAYQALVGGSIDVYPEYSGTISEVILKTQRRLSEDEMQAALRTSGLAMTKPLGFNDSYALAVTRSAAHRDGLAKISDLGLHPDLRLGLTHEFLGRPDGFPGLSRSYGLSMRDVRGLQHELAYEALATGQIDVMDIYTTDPQIERLPVVLLADDLGFFPRYDAVFLYRMDLETRAPGALAALRRVEGHIDQTLMTRANAAVVLEKASTEEAARSLLRDAIDDGTQAVKVPAASAARIGHQIVRHMELVGASLLFAIVLGVPIGIMATRSRWVAVVALTGAGILQTVPSLALLAFLIPLFGIGVLPALVALFVYSLLPIVRNTFTGLTSIPRSLSEAADAIGIPPLAKLSLVTVPMASPAIMAGIKTSAIINVGTATLAALIGAEGLGNPILQGIALRDTRLILEGAIPAALLALLVEGSFYLLGLVVVPKGLRLSSRAS
jgi:osmoprotectant transport system permease protein